MATDTAEDRRQHVRAATVTSLAALAGIAAALISTILTAELMATEGVGAAARDQTAHLTVLVAILVQFPIYRVLGFYDTDDFSAKLVIFIALMTFSMWFIAWGIFLTTGVTF